jgi:hypothetical protein
MSIHVGALIVVTQDHGTLAHRLFGGQDARQTIFVSQRLVAIKFNRTYGCVFHLALSSVPFIPLIKWRLQ